MGSRYPNRNQRAQHIANAIHTSWLNPISCFTRIYALLNAQVPWSADITPSSTAENDDHYSINELAK